MKGLFTLLFSFGAATALAQTPAIQWQKALGGTGEDIARSIQQTTDGGYIMAGSSRSNNGDVSGNHGREDVWVVKLDNTGAIQWQKALGGTDDDIAYSIQQTTDGGYIVAGASASTNGDLSGNHGYFDSWVVKLDNTGAIQWQKSLGGTDNDIAYSIQQTTDGGYILVGNSRSTNGDVTGNHGNGDAWVVKLDNTGIIQWQKALGGTNYDDASSIQQTTDGGYIVAGYSNSNDGDISGNHGGRDFWVVKLDNIGAIQWQKALGGTGLDDASSIQQTADGGYIIAGNAGSNDGDVSGFHGGIGPDSWVVKLDNTGAIQWQKALGGTGFDNGSSIQQTADGGYIIAGLSNSNDGDVTGNHGDVDYWVVKLNNAGAIQWQKSMGGTGVDGARSIQQTADGGYITAGYSRSNDGDVSGHHGNDDYWIVKLGPDPAAVSNVSPDAAFSLYPNPAQNEIFLQSTEAIRTIAVMDLSGKKVAQFSGNNASEMTLPTTGLANGTYFVRVETASGATTQKVLISRP